MTTPTNAAGRLLATISQYDDFYGIVLGVQREAVAAALARVRERVEGLKPNREDDGGITGPTGWYFDGWYEAQDAVLAILDEESALGGETAAGGGAILEVRKEHE
jgi:hypothetical protein